MAGRSVVGRRLTALGLGLALLGAALGLALVVPALQETPMRGECARLGGTLARSMERVEPLVVGRPVYDCIGPGGRVLARW